MLAGRTCPSLARQMWPARLYLSSLGYLSLGNQTLENSEGLVPESRGTFGYLLPHYLFASLC